MTENIFKVIFSAALAGLCAYLQVMLIPLIVLIAVMVLDYITGMAQAYKSKELNSRIGVNGIFKKVGYIILVCAGMVADYLICNGLAQIGVTIDISYTLALIVTIWLIINELISILENLSKLGVPMPEFLIKLVSRLKIAVEGKAEDK